MTMRYLLRKVILNVSIGQMTKKMISYQEIASYSIGLYKNFKAALP